jgi:toxin ParE1/3/4
MPEVRLSPGASADLDDILAYGLKYHHETTAKAYLLSFNKVFALLEDYPFSGQIDEEIGLRRWHHGSHRVFYQIEGDTVLIVRIIHHSRDVDQVNFDS